MTSNHSIERTCPGKPGHTAHVERYGADRAMKTFATFPLLLVACSPALAQPNFDFLYQDVLVALKRQCSEAYPDLKPKIDQTVQAFIARNAGDLSPDYLKKIEARSPDQRAYTREQCEGMRKLPEEPLRNLFKRAAEERQDEMKKRGEHERANR